MQPKLPTERGITTNKTDENVDQKGKRGAHQEIYSTKQELVRGLTVFWVGFERMTCSTCIFCWIPEYE
jgi:hypothetical protein